MLVHLRSPFAASPQWSGIGALVEPNSSKKTNERCFDGFRFDGNVSRVSSVEACIRILERILRLAARSAIPCAAKVIVGSTSRSAVLGNARVAQQMTGGIRMGVLEALKARALAAGNLHFIVGTMAAHPRTFIIIGLLRSTLDPDELAKQGTLL